MAEEYLSGSLKDDYNRSMKEINEIINNGTYKYTGRTEKRNEFIPVSSSAGYYKDVIYRETTGGIWVKSK